MRRNIQLFSQWKWISVRSSVRASIETALKSPRPEPSLTLMNWFYESAGQQQGPVSDTDLDRLVAEGKLTPDTLVWREGQATWLPLRQARPSQVAPPPPPTAGPLPSFGHTESGPGELVRCDTCGRTVMKSDTLQIGDRSICAACKPAALEQIQREGMISDFAGSRNGPPWEQRAQLGFVKAAWETMKGVLLNPGPTFREMRLDGIPSALLYLVILGSIGGIAGLLYQAALTAAMSRMPGMETTTSTSLNTNVMLSGVPLIIMTVLMPLLIAFGAFIASGINHLSLMVCGGAKRPFEATFRTYCFAAGSGYILQVVPFVGAIVGPIWTIVILCIGLAKVHEISTGKAVLAVFLPGILCCVSFVLIFGAIMGFALNAAPHH